MSLPEDVSASCDSCPEEFRKNALLSQTSLRESSSNLLDRTVHFSDQVSGGAELFPPGHVALLFQEFCHFMDSGLQRVAQNTWLMFRNLAVRSRLEQLGNFSLSIDIPQMNQQSDGSGCVVSREFVVTFAREIVAKDGTPGLHLDLLGVNGALGFQQ